MTTVEAALWLAYLAGAKEAVKGTREQLRGKHYEIDDLDEERLHVRFQAWLKEMEIFPNVFLNVKSK